jgi:hypothetical protein
MQVERGAVFVGRCFPAANLNAAAGDQLAVD